MKAMIPGLHPGTSRVFHLRRVKPRDTSLRRWWTKETPTLLQSLQRTVNVTLVGGRMQTGCVESWLFGRDWLVGWLLR